MTEIPTMQPLDQDDGRPRPSDELLQQLRSVRRRWFTLVSAGAIARAALAIAGVLVVFSLADRIARPGDGVLILLAALALLLAAAGGGWLLWPVTRRPTTQQLARYVEERCPELEDRVASAAEFADRQGAGPFRSMMMADAVARLREVDGERIVTREASKRALLKAGFGGLVLAGSLALAFAPLDRAGRAAWWRAFPGEVRLDVLPGDAKIPAGRPLEIVARVQGGPSDGGRGTATLTFGTGSERRSVSMPAVGEEYRFAFDSVTSNFTYRVSAAAVESREYTVTTLHAPKVQRIDVEYRYPAFSGLRARVEEDGGDIYAPAGTEVKLQVFADKPVKEGELVMIAGPRLGLVRQPDGILEGTFKVDEDGSYRVSLADGDGLVNPGETEYFIRTMDDRPPEVRIVRPGGDRQVTPLEEVTIEARADDDFGLERFELVYSVRGGPERAVRLPGAASARTLTASHTLFVEDLGVEPGDFITYYARARDVGRAKRSTEARSDIFFLEVKPFSEEFVAAQSQAAAGGGGDRSLDDLAAVQKEIIIATWKLDRRATGGKSVQDIKSVARAQGELRERAQQAMATLAGAGRAGGRSRRGRTAEPPAAPTDEPMQKAVEAMGLAEKALAALKTAEALPREMEALNELLKAQAEVRRRQVAQQQAGGGGGSNRAQQDLSALFDRELQRQQETNYETPANAQERQESPEDETLNKVRELARRQDEINRRERELARNRSQLTEEEIKRQLERLTREQSELRRQAEELSRQLARQEQQNQAAQSQSDPAQARGQTGTGPAGGLTSEGQMREISEEMRSAASELRREDAGGASARGERALERLRELEQSLQGAQPDDRRRAFGEAQLEAQQIAEAQQRIASEARRIDDTAGSNPDSARRLAGEKERLAGRVEQLQDRLERLASGTAGDDRRALAGAADDLERQRVAERMRQSAAALRQAERSTANRAQPGPSRPSQSAEPGQLARAEQSLAETLDQIAGRLGAAGGQRDPEARRLSEELARTRNLREQLRDVEERLENLARSSDRAGNEQSGNSDQSRSGARDGRGDTPAGQGSRAQASRGGRGRQGGSGQGGDVEQLQADYQRQAQEAQELINQLTVQAGARGGTPEQHQFSLSAPGTESFKQDFARWEELRVQISLALERRETELSEQLAIRETQDRLNAGADRRMPEEYRKLVAKYYQSLASRKKQP